MLIVGRCEREQGLESLARKFGLTLVGQRDSHVLMSMDSSRAPWIAVSAAATVSLGPGTFTSANGEVNNIGIAEGTTITTAIGGSGNDTFLASAGTHTFNGSGGSNKVVFTGSSENGQDVLARLAAKNTPAVMELSGEDSVIVLADADPQLVARKIGRYTNQHYGQTCCTVHRVYVDRKIVDDFIDAV